MATVSVSHGSATTRATVAPTVSSAGERNSHGYRVPAPAIAVCLALIFALIFGVYVFKFYVGRFPGRRPAPPPAKPRGTGLTRDALESIPIITHTPGAPLPHRVDDSSRAPKDMEDAPTSEDARHCAICTEELAHGVRLRQLPCGHRFHPECVDPWLLERSRFCPLCRIDAITTSLSINAPYDVPERPQRTVFAGRWRWLVARHCEPLVKCAYPREPTYSLTYLADCSLATKAALHESTKNLFAWTTERRGQPWRWRRRRLAVVRPCYQVSQKTQRVLALRRQRRRLQLTMCNGICSAFEQADMGNCDFGKVGFAHGKPFNHRDMAFTVSSAADQLSLVSRAAFAFLSPPSRRVAK